MNSATTSSTVHRPSRLRLASAALVVAGTAAVGLLSGCGAGQISQTAQKVSSVGGVDAERGDIAIRDAVVSAPKGEHWGKGEDAPLSLTLTNTGGRADKLVKVSSPVAASVELMAASEAESSDSKQAKPSGSAPPSSTSPSGSTSPSTPAGPSATASSSASTAPSPSPSASSPSPSADGAGARLVLPAGQAVFLSSTGTDGQRLVLRGLTEAIDSTDLVTVTLTFERAGSVRLELPVATPASPRARESLEHEGEQGEHGGGH